VLSPRRFHRIDPAVHRLYRRLLLAGQFLMSDDDEVDVAGDVSITGRKRTMKVRPTVLSSG
jgi:hypothetical protein